MSKTRDTWEAQFQQVVDTVLASARGTLIEEYTRLFDDRQHEAETAAAAMQRPRPTERRTALQEQACARAPGDAAEEGLHGAAHVAVPGPLLTILEKPAGIQANIGDSEESEPPAEGQVFAPPPVAKPPTITAAEFAHPDIDVRVEQACDSHSPSTWIGRFSTRTASGRSGSHLVSKRFIKERRLSLETAKALDRILETDGKGQSAAEIEPRPASFMESSFPSAARGSILEGLVGCIIFANSLTIGLSSEFESWEGWTIVDTAFAVVFSLEYVLKMWSTGCRSFFCGRDRRWNAFETILVFLANLEVAFMIKLGSANAAASPEDKMSIFRILRLARFARIVRMMRLKVFAELKMLMNGAVGGARTFMWSMVLISLPVYMMALVFREGLRNHVDEGNGADMFNNLPMAIFTIFRCLIGNECTTADGNPIFLQISSNFGWEYALAYCICSVFMTFGLFNVIVAIYVENTVAAAKFNDTYQKRQRLMNRQVFVVKIRQLVELVVRLHQQLYGRQSTSIMFQSDTLRSFEITPEYFETLRGCKEFQEILRDLDVADEDQLEMFDTLDVDGSGSVDIGELVEGIAKLRGDARRSDIIGMGLIIRSMQANLQSLNDNVSAKLQHQASSPALSGAASSPSTAAPVCNRCSGQSDQQPTHSPSVKFADSQETAVKFVD